MEFFGGLLVLFGVIVFPLILIIGLVKPSLFKKPDKTPASRKEISIFSVVAGMLCLGIGGAMLPAVEEVPTATVNKPVDQPAVAKSDAKPIADVPVIAEVEAPPKVEEPIVEAEAVKAERTLPDFNMTSEQFVKNYNLIIAKADKNMIINGIDNSQTVSYAPMPSNASMSGIISDNGNLRGIILVIGGGENQADNLKAVAISLAAANAVNGSVAKEEISQAVLDMLPAAIDNKGESQKKIIGNASYAANFSEGLGGLFFTIDAI